MLELLRGLDIDAEWKGPEWVQTRQHRPATRVHPTTGEQVFVASPHVWHHRAWSHYFPELLNCVTEPVTSASALDGHWMHVTYGDGTPIEDAVIDEIIETYRNEQVMFDWHRGDVLLIDNLLVSHGRMPYAGARNILAALRVEAGDVIQRNSGAIA